MTQYVIRLAMPGPESASRAENASAVLLAARLVEASVAGRKGGAQAGDYLVWSDADANGGEGAETWSADPVKARRFKSREAALACYMAQSKLRPKRLDGKPNRPMTAYSVVVEPAP